MSEAPGTGRTIDVGVFIPVGNHGWIHSTNAPAVEDGSFGRVLDVTRHAETLGFDFVLSPAIWRGRAGPSEHWMRSLESLTTSAALLQATSRIGVFSTVHMTIYPPAIVAKMMATLDQVGPGRVGLNLVTGASYLDLSHVGLWREELSHDERYDLGDEWVAVARRLWTEQTVSHKGRFYELTEATMGPKPSRLPPLANAGASGRGLRFAVENCDIAFVVSGEEPKYAATSLEAKRLAREMSRPGLKVYGLLNIVPGESDDAAAARVRHFNDGVDVVCLEDIRRGYSMNPDIKGVSAASQRLGGDGSASAVVSGAMVGSYEGLAKRIAAIVEAGDLDGIIVVVPDYIADLERIAERTLAGMSEWGIDCRVCRR